MKIFSLALLTITLLAALALPTYSSALSGSDFKAGRIIDDGVFFNPKTMSVDDIQYFLNIKVPTCDTNGEKIYSGTMTRAEYGASKGSPAPYTCLKTYSQDTPSRAAESQLCNAYIGGVKTSAQIIHDVAQACGVNPHVLLVLLQKEQSLVTDEWPWPIQYRSATGFGCPDTAPCDAEYYGFFNQVYNAARIYKKYARDASLYNYRKHRDNNILFNPSSACGSSTVYLENQATTGLYIYTPYQPNQAALNNLYGLGDGCSAYGNRNFWRMYTDWFGSTFTSIPYGWLPASQESHIDQTRTKAYSSTTINMAPGSKAYLRVKARNMGYQIWDKSIVHLGTSNPNDSSSPFADISWLSPKRIEMIESSVLPGETATFELTISAPSETGIYNQYFNVVADGITWLNDPGLYYSINVVDKLSPTNTENTQLLPGESIVPGDLLMSEDSQTVLRLRNEGDLSLFSAFKKTWTNGIRSSKVKGVFMQNDGNLVAYSTDDLPLWSTNTGNNPGAYLVMQTDGNAVVYSSSGVALWASSTQSTPDFLSQVTYRLDNESLYPGQSLLTPDQKYRMVLQKDGNLVVYGAGKALWASGTNGQKSSHLSMQPDGNLVIYSGAGKALWASGTNGQKSSHLSMQPDGNLVVYSQAGKALWSTNTSNRL